MLVNSYFKYGNNIQMDIEYPSENPSSVMLSYVLSNIVKGKAKAYFVLLVKYKHRYGCVMFVVGKFVTLFH